jgi:drug/metabolite transporter (DMT)-like permease
MAMAMASGCFILALNHTTVAAVLFIQAATPIVAAVMAWLVLRERSSARSMLAMLVAAAGVAVMVGNPAHGQLVGSALALLVAVSFAAAIVITRARREVSMAPATAVSQAILVVAATPFAHVQTIGMRDAGLLIALGVVQMAAGLALFTAGARLIPVAQAGLLTLLEVVLGPLWVWASIGETPSAATLAGGAIVIAALLLVGGGTSAPSVEPDDVLAKP